MIHFYLKHRNKVRAAQLAARGGVSGYAKVQEQDGEVVSIHHGMLDLVRPCKHTFLAASDLMLTQVAIRRSTART